jgi:hypothetical protein
MDQNRVKHLELIQAVITRLASNSFAYKAWTIGLVSALFAFGATARRPLLVLLPAVPVSFFAVLDAYYLQQERHFRGLFDAVRRMSDEEWQRDPFSMSVGPHRKKEDTLLAVLTSPTIAGLYAPLLLVVLAIAGVAFAVEELRCLHVVWSNYCLKP